MQGWTTEYTEGRSWFRVFGVFRGFIFFGGFAFNLLPAHTPGMLRLGGQVRRVALAQYR